jgi:hypothetical protein
MSQKKPEAMEKATAIQRAESIWEPTEASMSGGVCVSVVFLARERERERERRVKLVTYLAV